jgi:5'(3')-deoxyribonucleotidase
MPALPTVPWFVDTAEEIFGEHWFIVTRAMGSDRHCHIGKLEWVRKNIPQAIDRTIITRHKHLLAGPGRILIDDAEFNVNDWNEHGGTGILYPAHHNSLHREFMEQPDQFLRHREAFLRVLRELLLAIGGLIETSTPVS